MTTFCKARRNCFRICERMGLKYKFEFYHDDERNYAIKRGGFGTKGNTFGARCLTNYEKDGYIHVQPFMITRSYVWIVCPYCGLVHAHGTYRDESASGTDPGFRVPHCADFNEKKSYYIDAPTPEAWQRFWSNCKEWETDDE